MTNTSEPHADDMAIQAQNPIDFDWMLKGVCGLNATIEMMDDVQATTPFGSFFVYTELPDLPYLAVDADAFRKEGFNDVADLLEKNGNCWSRKIEEKLYEAHGLTHPL